MTNPENLPGYVLVTPARNEADYIGGALKAVVAQTIRPRCWVIVSDGSTDATDEIARRCAADHQWIRLMRTPERPERHFAGKVHAFNAGYASARDVPHDVVACMDADITFEPDYFEYLLRELAQDPSLGVVGTPFQELSGHMYDYRFVSLAHVSGACQVFRRACFEEIGGYIPIETGSIDHIAVLNARLRGWNTRTFTDKVCVHHRQVGTAEAGQIIARFKYGMKDYAIGNAPLWELFRSLYQLAKPPYLVGGLALAFGYVWSCLRRRQRLVSPELVTFHRKEQMERLKTRLFGGHSSVPVTNPSSEL